MKIPVEDEIEVVLSQLENLIQKTNDVDFLKQVKLSLIFIGKETSAKITKLYRNNRYSHALCKKYTLENGKVVYGHGSTFDDGRPVYLCHECTEEKGERDGH